MTMGRKKVHLDSLGPKTVGKQNLEGKVFGQPTVLFVLKDEKNNTKGHCRCDCGNECEITQKDLVTGRKQSCGCVKRKRGNEPTDLTGRRFGRLVAICQTNERTSKGCVIWQCRCDCGNTVTVSSDNLLGGNQRSCGCLRAEKMHEAREKLHFVDGTCLEWLKERKDRMDNTSGYKGISRRKNGRYFAKIGFQNRQYYLGTFDKIEDAVAVRQKAETLLFDNFLNEYRSWEDGGGKEGFHFDAEAVKASLSELRGAES